MVTTQSVILNDQLRDWLIGKLQFWQQTDAYYGGNEVEYNQVLMALDGREIHVCVTCGDGKILLEGFFYGDYYCNDHKPKGYDAAYSDDSDDCYWTTWNDQDLDGTQSGENPDVVCGPIDYDPGDFLLLNEHGQIQAVSGNSKFDDIEGEPSPICLSGPHLIVKVVEVN